MKFYFTKDENKIARNKSNKNVSPFEIAFSHFILSLFINEKIKIYFNLSKKCLAKHGNQPLSNDMNQLTNQSDL